MYLIPAYRDPLDRPARRALAEAIAPRLARLPPPLPAPANQPAARIHTISTRSRGDQVRHLDRPEDDRRREEQDRRGKRHQNWLDDIVHSKVGNAAGGAFKALMNTGESLVDIGREVWDDREEILEDLDETLEGAKRGARLLMNHRDVVADHYLKKGKKLGGKALRSAGEVLADVVEGTGEVLEGASRGAKLLLNDPVEAGRRVVKKADEVWQGAEDLYGDVREGVRDVGEWMEAVEEDPGKLLRDARDAYNDFKHWSTVATQEASLGSSDEIFAFLRALAGKEGTFQERYKHELGVQRDFLKRYEEARPNAAASAKFVGGALTTLKLFGRAGLIGRRSKDPLVRGLLAPGERLVTQIPKGGAGFGTLGALYGFMTGEGGLEERLQKMMDDAAWFGLLGAVQPFGAGPLDAFRRRFGDKLSAFLTKEGNHRIAARQFAATIKKQFGNLSEEELIELVKQRLGEAGRAMRIGPKLEKEFRELARRRAGKKNSAAEAWRLATGSRRPAKSLPEGARREYQRLLRSSDPEALEQALRQGLKSHALEGDWLPWWVQSLGWKGMGDSLEPWFWMDQEEDEEEQARRERRAPPRQIPRRLPPPQSG